MKLLKDILYKVKLSSVVGPTGVLINTIQFDSRKVCDEDLFIAVPGTKSDGNDYVKDAIDKGAKAILTNSLPPKTFKEITYIKVDDVRQSLARVASNFYDNPSHKLNLIGITGTNGKTTTSTLMYQLFKLFNQKVGLISTNKISINDDEFETDLTTPDPLTLNKVLNDMTNSKVKYCFMEVSSHSIKQKRIDGLNFKVGVFTNLSHDHLDYHKTFKEYRNVKKAFFDSLESDSVAIINADDKNGEFMVQNCKSMVIKYAQKTNSNHLLKILEKDFNGMKINIDGVEVWTKLIGKFNAYNLLATYSLAKNYNFSNSEILNKISLLDSVAGRFEKVYSKKTNKIGIIDYAHSPDSIQNILETINDLKNKSSLITVIGCGGDRDTKKRPVMGRIAASLSDKVVLTSDNPRFEDPNIIIEQMLSGIEKKDKHKVYSIVDRKKAIKHACEMSSDNDVILVAGKGHEKYQIQGIEKNDFDDKLMLKKFLKSKS